ncbi:CoA transferase [Stutzerimonas zhaodongensis]|uniref:CoA transferase n=1 Tax=Stutzerimonas zhaodongensis TaxID=1176257 RepID=A0A3M2HVL2_9GAMM|nr:CaiB/BaiF CoA-transferase family protein [Stutzerimonas zhaodongensis]MCQ2028090.1 CoA transferase [Stutzerimonas zhaodongensis]MCQ4315688.1 CoA transferase [Stutzerimonas zhaodongensis]RMH91449.1 CoA transferase [Stutzerimonas zhaodongensis]
MSALSGIKVLDLTRIMAGPWSTMALADLGAEVWKIESLEGDDTRSWMPPATAGISTYYLSANRSKQSLAVDLRKPEGRQLILDLAAQADVVVENFLPASLKRLGLDYEALSAVNPRLIHCSITGYGRGNPMENRPGYDFIIQAESGFMSITGEKDGEPMRLGVAFIDLVTGMNAVQGILAALFEREKSGLGQSIDIALSDSALHFLANIASGYLNTGKVPQRYGNAHASIVPYQLFDTADGSIALAVGNDEQYRRLCLDVLERPDLYNDPRFTQNKSRTEHRTLLIPLLQAVFRAWPSDALIDALRAQAIPVGEVKDVAQALESETARYRQLVMSVEHPVAGEVRMVRSPLRFSRTPTVAAKAPPLHGQHTDEVLGRVLGKDEAELASLREAGVIL